MKKLLILSIALLAAVPGVEAKCNTCSSSQNAEQQCGCGAKKCTCAKAKVCTKCKKAGKEKCACGHPASCKCSSEHKDGPVKTTAEQQCKCEKGKCKCAAKCKKDGKKSCKCVKTHKAAKYSKGSGNIFKETGDVVAAPFRLLAGDDAQEEDDQQAESEINS